MKALVKLDKNIWLNPQRHDELEMDFLASEWKHLYHYESGERIQPQLLRW